MTQRTGPGTESFGTQSGETSHSSDTPVLQNTKYTLSPSPYPRVLIQDLPSYLEFLHTTKTNKRSKFLSFIYFPVLLRYSILSYKSTLLIDNHDHPTYHYKSLTLKSELLNPPPLFQDTLGTLINDYTSSSLVTSDLPNPSHSGPLPPEFSRVFYRVQHHLRHFVDGSRNGP